jgi:hypothetical protein
MPKDAYVLRRFTDAGENKRYPAGAVILGMDDGRFGNLKAGVMVRLATAAEVAGARAGKAPAPTDSASSHPRALVPPPPPAAAPKRVRKQQPPKERVAKVPTKKRSTHPLA